MEFKKTYFGFDDVRNGNVVGKSRFNPRGVDVRLERTEADVDVVRAIFHARCFPICDI